MRTFHLLAVLGLAACGPTVFDLSGSHANDFEVFVDEPFIIDCGGSRNFDEDSIDSRWSFNEYRDGDGNFVRNEDSIVELYPDVVDVRDEALFGFMPLRPGTVQISIEAYQTASTFVTDTCGAQFIVR